MKSIINSIIKSNYPYQRY